MRCLSIVVILLAVFCVRGWAEVEKGLAAHWKFDEGKGDVLHDRSGNQNHGKIHGATWVKCGRGYALQFDGMDDYVDCGTGPSLDITGPITLEAWVYPESVPKKGEAGIVGKFFTSYALTYYFTPAYATPGCYWYISSGGNFCRMSLDVGSWQHVAGAFDGTTMSVYVDAKPVRVHKSKFKTVKKGKNFLMGCIVGDPTATDPAYRGTTHFEGMIDDVRLYARTLSDKEMIGHYNESAQEKGRPLMDASWFDRFKLTPYFYLDKNELVVNVDFRGLLPVPEGAEIRAELARTGVAKPLQTRKIEARPQPGYAEVTFTLTDFTLGTYEIRAVLAAKGRVRSKEKLSFQYPPAPPQVPSPATKLVAPLPKPLDPVTYDLQLCDGGGFKILIAGDAYPVESTFSYPHGGENTLLAASAKGPECEASWAISTRKVGTKEYRVLARGKYCAIERRINLHPHHLAISDTIANPTDKDIGIVINNYLDTGGKNLSTCYLGGIKGRGRREALHNPTTFVGKKNLGLGLVAIDDVSVVQSKVYGEKDRAGILDDMFGLGPRASYTMTWSIYPVGSEDYFDFINVIRNELGLNGKTVDGPLTYVDRKKPLPENTLRGLRSKYICLGCLAWCADDPGISIEGIEFIDFPKERAFVKKVFAEIREKYPDAYPMFHIAHSLYATNRPERYADSRVIDKNGKQVVYSTNRTYREKFFSKEKLDAGWSWYIFYPTLDNSFGKAMLEAVDVMMDEMGSTGVFADGLMHGYGGRFTYDRWDGHTVEIDPKTKQIKRKFASVHLLCQDAIMAYCKKIASKGGAVLCDSGPGTLTFARKAPVAACPIETGSDEACRLTHLAPFPMALGWPKYKPEPKVYRDIRAKLRWGVLWYDYYWRVGRSSIFSRMYPITIEEIHSGYVKGKERLVTMHSGVYGWPKDENLHFAYLSDARGLLVPHNFLTTVDNSGVRTHISLKENEMAVLKKLPVTIRFRRPINLIAQQYDEKAMQILLNGKGTIQVIVRDGDFPVKPGAAYRVTTSREQTITASRDGILSFPLRLEGQMKLRIERSVEQP